MSATPFSSRVAEGMLRRGLTLRQFCRAVSLDPSFFSKVLSGKRSPPAEESVLRRIAVELELDAAELIVSAGRIPEEWQSLWRDPGLFRDMNSLATGRPAAKKTKPAAVRAAAPVFAAVLRRPEQLSEELL